MKIVLTKVFIILWIFFIVSITPYYGRDRFVKVGFIDLEKVWSESQEFKKAKIQIQHMEESFLKMKEKQAQAIAVLENQINTASGSPNKIATQAQKLRTLKSEYIIYIQQENDKISKTKEKLLYPLEKKLQEIIAQKAKLLSIDLVLDKRYVVFGDKDLDITSNVMREF